MQRGKTAAVSAAAACRCAAAPRAQARRRASVATAAVAGSSGGLAVVDYLGRGPYATSALAPLTFQTGQQGSSGSPLECTVQVFVPQGLSRGGPLLVLSAGFLLASGLYRSYGEDLASWGFTVALYDLPEVVDDAAMVTNLGSIINTCMRDPRVKPFVDASAGVLLAGHSRGGKLSALAAAGDPRVKGVALLDPVDVTAMTPTGPGYPSALPAMRVACGAPRSMPALVIGAGMNGDVIPADGNYRRFVTACPGPCWSLDLQTVGHLQFLDMQVGIFAMFSKPGPTPDDVVRRVTKAALVAWALELAVPLARGEQVDGAQVAERLQQTARLVSGQAPLSSTVKGFAHLGGPDSTSWSGGSNGSGGGGSAAQSSAASGASYDAAAIGSFLNDLGSRFGGYGAGAPGAPGAASSPSSASTSRPSSSGQGSSSAGARGGSSWSRSAGQFARDQAGTGTGTSGASSSSSGSSAGSGASYGTSQARTSGTSGASGASASSGAGAGGGSARASGPSGTWTREALMGMRAKELKAILTERNVYCADCYEKEDLVKRVLERC